MIASAAKEAQQQINSELRKVDGQPAPESGLDQFGLRDGEQIILEFLEHGEEGLALEHLDYMVNETCIALSVDLCRELRKLANDMGVDVRF